MSQGRDCHLGKRDPVLRLSLQCIVIVQVVNKDSIFPASLSHTLIFLQPFVKIFELSSMCISILVFFTPKTYLCMDLNGRFAGLFFPASPSSSAKAFQDLSPPQSGPYLFVDKTSILILHAVVLISAERGCPRLR